MSKSKTHKFYEENPAGAVADALQLTRIPGTTTHLHEKFSSSQLMSFGESVVAYLKSYGLEIVPRKDG